MGKSTAYAIELNQSSRDKVGSRDEQGQRLIADAKRLEQIELADKLITAASGGPDKLHKTRLARLKSR